MLVVVTLLFTDSATARATLGRTPRIDLDNNTVIFNSFVGQELFQLVECPRALFVILLLRALQVAFLERNAC